MVALDALSLLLLGAVALRFGWIAHVSRRSLPLLFAAGMGLVALSYPTVSAAHLSLGGPAFDWDSLRIIGQGGGVLIVVCAYSAARLGGRRWLLAAGWAVAATTVLLALVYYTIPSIEPVPVSQGALAIAHGGMALAWAGVAAIASARMTTAPRAHAALVPAAFLALAVGKVAWLAVDLGAGAWVVAVVYLARTTALLLLLNASMPRLWRREVTHASA